MSNERKMPEPELKERDMLVGWLEFHRATLLSKCEGLTDDQLRDRSVSPSSMSLIGLVRHCTEVERNWFQRVLQRKEIDGIYYNDTDPDGDFDNVGSADIAEDFAIFHEACEESRRAANLADSLDVTGVRRGNEVSLRWILVHLVEEYARHNGHADLLRECVDGKTGG